MQNTPSQPEGALYRLIQQKPLAQGLTLLQIGDAAQEFIERGAGKDGAARFEQSGLSPDLFAQGPDGDRGIPQNLGGVLGAANPLDVHIRAHNERDFFGPGIQQRVGVPQVWVGWRKLLSQHQQAQNLTVSGQGHDAQLKRAGVAGLQQMDRKRGAFQGVLVRDCPLSAFPGLLRIPV